MKNRVLVNLLLLNVFFSFSVLAQSQSSVNAFPKKNINWYNADLKEDKIAGASVNKAYNLLLKDKKTRKTVIVAIIDSGVDIDHEDLKGRIWVNEKEIPGNGIDDDGNGYVDDVHGWGFLGNDKGKNIETETYEFVRILRKYDPVFKNIQSEADVPANQINDYRLYLKVKEKHEAEVAEQTLMNETLKKFEKVLTDVEKVVLKHLGTRTYTVEDLKGITNANRSVLYARDWLLDRYKQGFSREELEKMKERTETQLKENLSLSYNPREIIGDDIENINDSIYGNNDVKGPRADHGTPVSGVIGAIRGNGTGIDGIAEDVRFMVLRAVPNGDEYDKDIALAIRYAVNNGANVINMSFGKEFSPQKKFVDDAIRYAEAHNVLLVHAAGNSAYDIDEIIHYPSRACNDGNSVNNWLEVGANSIKADKRLCASFSNYGKNNVALFAPGVEIVSLAEENTYTMVNGTSFAGPVVSGVAALVWSYYPELTAIELRNILLNSCTNLNKKKVLIPGGKADAAKVPFSNLSSTGGIVNAYQALLMAEKIVSEKKSAKAER
jgi:subtilisin family serine protease